MAQEERIFDEHLLARINEGEAARILTANAWPERFATYEDVLRIARALATPCCFLEPMADSLIWTIEDLRRDRPDSVSRRSPNFWVWRTIMLAA
ncbi:hypothetical protein [Sphingomonas sp. 1185]|uniref:hypothetical protein n=1 Tax=Sphingomonas sp. 1185 TaxID=3156411 RepID=UPI003393EA3C